MLCCTRTVCLGTFFVATVPTVRMFRSPPLGCLFEHGSTLSLFMRLHMLGPTAIRQAKRMSCSHDARLNIRDALKNQTRAEPTVQNDASTHSPVTELLRMTAMVGLPASLANLVLPRVHRVARSSTRNRYKALQFGSLRHACLEAFTLLLGPHHPRLSKTIVAALKLCQFCRQWAERDRKEHLTKLAIQGQLVQKVKHRK